MTARPTVEELREAWPALEGPNHCPLGPLKCGYCALRAALDLLAEVEANARAMSADLSRCCNRRTDLVTGEVSGDCAALAEAQRDTERLAGALALAMALIDDLRSYTHDWDWKYGETWDREKAAIDAARDGEEGGE